MVGIECADIYIEFPEIMEEEFKDLIEFLDYNHITYNFANSKVIDLENKVKDLENQVTEYQDEIFARDNNWYDMQD